MSEQPNKKENSTNPSSADDCILFSNEEMASLVKGFIIAYLNDKIHLDPLRHKERKQESPLGVALYRDEDIDMDYKVKEQLQKTIDKILGTVSATKEERKLLIRGLFGVLFTYKMNGWLEGSFYDFSLEKKIAEIEKKYANHDEIIHGYIAHLREAFNV